MLTLHQLNKSYNIKPILKDISFSVNRGERVGLIGPNGSGKTTLLRIVAGQETADSGQVAFTPGSLRVGYLAQGFEAEPTLTLAEVVGQVMGDPAQLEIELAHLATALVEQPDQPELQAQYDAVLQKLSQLDRGRVPHILATFHLDTVDPAQPIGQLSGGQKTRLSLALLLLNEPDLLLLDEPTNHLDIAMLEWLEEWLADFPGGALIVSHDRTFLDNTVNRIIDLNPETQTARSYVGNYSDYLEQFGQEKERQWDTYRDQELTIQRMQADISRTKEQARWVEVTTKPNNPGVRRYAKKVARKAKSREKRLERFLSAPDRLEKPKQGWQLKVAFDQAAHLGRDVLLLDDVAVGYETTLLHDLNLVIQAGERVVLTGPNGTGKSTLVKTIMGELRPRSGTIRLGHSVKLGYMTQEQEGIDPALTPLATIQQASPMNQTEVRSFLHYFLFTGDEAVQSNHSLSFGQRARLALARLVAQGCNFLVLDEPINHLDIPSRNLFEQALAQFEGSILAVVHDRYFIEQFATTLWIVDNRSIRTQ